MPIWWAYAASLMLITAGFFFGRAATRTVCTPEYRQPAPPSTSRSRGCCRCCRCRTWTASSTTWSAADQSDDAQPGVRVRVRFHGRLVDAFILERRSDTDHPRQAGLAGPGGLRRTGADPRDPPARPTRWPPATSAPGPTCCGWPSRRGMPTVEKQAPPELPPSAPTPVDESGWARYGRGDQFLDAIRRRPGRAGGVAGAAGGAVAATAGRGRRGDGARRASVR